MPTDLMIHAEDVVKSFGTHTALDGVTLRVPRGTVLGLLGHNGAGKTTLINVLTTVLPPDGGTASVAGFDVVAEGAQVRSSIGLTGQYTLVDEDLTGRQNLVMIARLLGLSSRDARRHAAELLESFGLVDAADRKAGKFSGGMKRRLDLAVSLVGRPHVVFLDEPTTGLDPTSRIALWETVERLTREEGTTVLLTTQYMEEADRLADAITVLSHGRVVASGTAGELKAGLGRRTVTITPSDPALASEVLSRNGFEVGRELDAVHVPVSATREVAVVVRLLTDADVDLAALTVTEPSLDDVYLALAAQPRGVLQ
ncbi:daunorubicin ABC transporter ATPase [Saccharothrix coeruleofusca]|uniref:Daunorubicin ABC transporter ATPase n=2 Tax=Saccharothrix coeruleofusca TaxID=33919 RepID=A0A918ARQ6_9PSEU|nr:daunorubicin ABC transporter ATPase [Saccharothrix coeruleofusca]